MTIQFHEWRCDRIKVLQEMHGHVGTDCIEHGLNRRDEIKQWVDHVLIPRTFHCDCLDITGLQPREVDIAIAHIAKEFRGTIWSEAVIAGTES